MTVEAWEKDDTCPNLYYHVVKHTCLILMFCIFDSDLFADMSEVAVKAKLKDEDQKSLEQGQLCLHKTLPSSFISMRLMVKETQ